jgi:signal transduction histidine kinase
MSEDEREDTCRVDETRIEEQIIERMGQISSELAHDLRGPLQTIQNAIYLIQRNPDNDQLYVMVKQSLTQATELLDNFRDYYKAHQLQRLNVDPSKVVELAFSELPIPDNITVVKELKEIHPIDIDPQKMALAIRKLLINSIEAMPDGGELTVKDMETPQSVVITISDTGVGISPDLADIIYTPFMANQKKGRGLGVPTAQRVVESHGGHLSYVSENGKGTVFTIELPRIKAEP